MIIIIIFKVVNYALSQQSCAHIVKSLIKYSESINSARYSYCNPRDQHFVIIKYFEKIEKYLEGKKQIFKGNIFL